MSRVITNQNNLWGKQSGIEPQRSDLWIVDFSLALTGLSGAANVSGLASVVNGRTGASSMNSGVPVPYVPPAIPTYYASSVTLPDLKIRSEAVRRDSRSYPMPSWDESLEPVRINFLLDCFKPGGAFKTPYQSDIYQMLDVWRAVVRAGRGSVSSEYSITLDNNYRIDYAFDLRVMMMRASSAPSLNPDASDPALIVSNDLEFSLQLRLVNCWLSSFRVSELNYEGAKMVQIEALFHAEDIRQEAQQQQSIAVNNFQFNPSNVA